MKAKEKEIELFRNDKAKAEEEASLLKATLEDQGSAISEQWATREAAEAKCKQLEELLETERAARVSCLEREAESKVNMHCSICTGTWLL